MPVVCFYVAVITGDKARAQVFAERAVAVETLIFGLDHPANAGMVAAAERPVVNAVFWSGDEFSGGLLGSAAWDGGTEV